MENTSKLKVGLIGAGRIGNIHAQNLTRRTENVELTAVADIVLPAAQALAARFGVQTAVADYHFLLDSPAIQAVIICSATDTHAVIIEEAAAAGKHIFCEKPIDLDLAKIDRALDAVSRAGVKLQVGFNRRFDSNFRRVHELVVEGRIGRPQVLRITSRDPAPPPLDYVRLSGGIFVDMAIHDFDMARYLVGSEVDEVYATGGVLIDPQFSAVGDVDTAVTMLRFANGAIGTIDNSRQAVYGYDQRVEVFGSGGAVSVSNNTPDRAVVNDAEGVHGALPLYFFLERYMDSFAEEIRQFVQAVREDKPTPVGGIDGRMAVVIALAASKSLREHRPVQLCEFD